MSRALAPIFGVLRRALPARVKSIGASLKLRVAGRPYACFSIARSTLTGPAPAKAK